MPRNKIDPESRHGRGFPKRFRMLMEETGVRRKDVAEWLGVSTQAIANYENAISSPDWEGLITIADKFGVSMDYLLERSDIKTTNTDVQAVCSFTGLSQKSVQNIRTMYENRNIGANANDAMYGLEYVLSGTATFNMIFWPDVGCSARIFEKEDEYTKKMNTQDGIKWGKELNSLANDRGYVVLSAGAAASFYMNRACDVLKDMIGKAGKPFRDEYFKTEE